mmetsp:Transcript_29315/g.61618  ORF Transcript_29315/g.61618 Transcript_29315/m.61618 type:complete len:219 (-) Transcript_29315:752-1408(-)
MPSRWTRGGVYRNWCGNAEANARITSEPLARRLVAHLPVPAQSLLQRLNLRQVVVFRRRPQLREVSGQPRELLVFAPQLRQRGRPHGVARHPFCRARRGKPERRAAMVFVWRSAIRSMYTGVCASLKVGIGRAGSGGATGVGVAGVGVGVCGVGIRGELYVLVHQRKLREACRVCCLRKEPAVVLQLALELRRMPACVSCSALDAPLHRGLCVCDCVN